MLKLRRTALIVALLTALFIIGVLPAAAGLQTPGTINSVTTEGCTVYISVTLPAIQQSAAESKTFAKRGALGTTVYALIYDAGELLQAIPVSGAYGQTVQVTYTIDRLYIDEDIGINYNPNNDGDYLDYFDYTDHIITDEVASACIQTADTCPNGVPAGSVQGRVIFTTPAYWAPSLAATTNVVIPVGTSWWVVDAEAGFYQLEIACRAQRVWVPAESLGANFDLYFYGAPLPDAGSANN